jgi:hypothetical protein
MVMAMMVAATACSTTAATPVDVADTVGAASPGAGASEPTTVATVPPSDGPRRPSGFATARAVVTEADGSTCELCVWLADTSSQRRLGLMFVTDLGVADGMAFRYPRSHSGTFWMKNTPLPLSIAFFAPDGAYLESFDMAPCPDGTCPKYATPDDFLVAVEVPQGHLEELGLSAGSTLQLLDLPCDD